jgi:formylglycine-generating enzyme required for sulfatase activity
MHDHDGITVCGSDIDAPPRAARRGVARDQVATCLDQRCTYPGRRHHPECFLEDPPLGDSAQIETSLRITEFEAMGRGVELNTSPIHRLPGGEQYRGVGRDSGSTFLAPQLGQGSDGWVKGPIAPRGNLESDLQYGAQVTADGVPVESGLRRGGVEFAVGSPIAEYLFQRRDPGECRCGGLLNLCCGPVPRDLHLEAEVDFAELMGHPLPRQGQRVQVEQQAGEDHCAPSPYQFRSDSHPMKLSCRALAVLLLLMPIFPIAAQAPTIVRDSLPSMRLSWEMVLVPGGTVVLHGDTVQVEPFLIGRTEVPWDLYDVFYLRLDVPRAMRDSVDARLRPSRPYGAPDRGFGHRGYPAISLTYGATTRFVTWLSERTGHRYTVMTDAQWQRAAELAFPGGRAESGQRWVAESSEAATHPVGTSTPDALGLYDLLGNVGEWVVGRGDSTWLRGGSFADSASAVTTQLRIPQHFTWNQTDPQIPKSRWWLSDGPFAGFRLVRIP